MVSLRGVRPTKQSCCRRERLPRPRLHSGSQMTQVIWFNTALEAHAGLKDILKSGDVILFKNDWGDQYHLD